MILYYFHWVVVTLFTIFLYLLVTVNNIISLIETDESGKTYDYIIVGGGTAGAIIATRLSENPQISILLIEAGIIKPSLLDIPALGPLQQLSELDWQYLTVPQKNACFGLKNNSSKWPAGKVLGGTGHLNYMMYVRGYHKDYIHWQDPESDNWSFEDVISYFEKAKELIFSDTDNNNHNNGASLGKQAGSQLVRNISFTTQLSEAMLKAASELGFGTNDINSEMHTGFMKPQLNMNKFGRRWTSDKYLLATAGQRKNLKILTNAFAQKILFRNDYEAYGVEYEKGGRISTVFANEEIILSAGTIGSPKLLLLSGVGPKETLIKAGVDVKMDLPVGKNLQDHVTTGLDLIILNETIFSLNDLTNPMSAYEYFVNGRGPFTSAICETVGLIHSDLVDANFSLPDLEFMVMMAGLSSDGGVFSRHAIGVSDELWNDYFTLMVNESVVTVLPVLLHPKSVGEITLDPKNRKGMPLIDPRYLSKDIDVKTLISGIRVIQQIIETKPMKELGAKLNDRILPGCQRLKFNTDAYWECYIRHVTLTSYHPVGTCRMGIGEDAVVDHRLRLLKANKLRIIDASVMPTLPSGNTNAAVAMTAEKGADLIKEDYNKKALKCSACDMFVKPNTCFVSSYVRDSKINKCLF